jgi:hypothetical protein
MVKVGSVILLFCGALALIGFFLPWAGGKSGWEAISEFGVNEDTFQAFLVFIGSIVIIVFSVPMVVFSTRLERSYLIRNLGILTLFGAITGLVGASWLLCDAISSDALDFFRYGFYMSFAGVVAGLLFGVITTLFANR